MPHHCHDEHCEHDHSSDITPAIQNHLYSQLDFTGVRTLNEAQPGSGCKVLQKTWSEREDATPEIESDADEQLIVHIPFTGQVRLHSIHIRTSPSDSAPRTLHVYANNLDLDFSSASSTSATQTFSLAQTSEVQDIAVKRTKFTACRSISLFFEDNWSGGAEHVTRVSYIGLKGDFMKLNREPVEVLYEAAANPSDHKVKGTEVAPGMGIGGGGGRQGF